MDCRTDRRKDSRTARARRLMRRLRSYCISGLLCRIAANAPPTFLRPTKTMELLEREQCLADLTAWFAAARQHGGCTVLVSGEAGIGKTALLQEFAHRQGEARVLWGACDALLTPRPLGPLHDIARQLHGRLLATLSSAARPDTLFTTLLDELERIKALVVFEDVHWADEATLDLLPRRGPRPAAPVAVGAR
jgi:predicted ATPase